MDQPQKKSYKMLWIAGASVIVLLVIIGGAFYLVSQSANNKQASSSSSPKPSSKVATKQELKNNIDKLATQMKKANADRTALEAALKTAPKKVSQ